jgi:hypothetical protein
VDTNRIVGVIQCLSLTGGSAILSKGPIAQGTIGEMILNTTYGKVTAQIEFLQTGADGIPLAQAFRFIDMDDASRQRYDAAAKKMHKEGFSDQADRSRLNEPAGEVLGDLLTSVRRIAAKLVTSRNP